MVGKFENVPGENRQLCVLLNDEFLLFQSNFDSRSFAQLQPDHVARETKRYILMFCRGCNVELGSVCLGIHRQKSS